MAGVLRKGDCVVRVYMRIHLLQALVSESVSTLGNYYWENNSLDYYNRLYFQHKIISHHNVQQVAIKSQSVFS